MDARLDWIALCVLPSKPSEKEMYLCVLGKFQLCTLICMEMNECELMFCSHWDIWKEFIKLLTAGTFYWIWQKLTYGQCPDIIQFGFHPDPSAHAIPHKCYWYLGNGNERCGFNVGRSFWRSSQAKSVGTPVLQHFTVHNKSVRNQVYLYIYE